MLEQAEWTRLDIPVATVETGVQSESTVHFEPCTHSQLYLKNKTQQQDQDVKQFTKTKELS